MPGTNIEVYYENPYIRALKSFIVQAPGLFLFIVVKPSEPSSASTLKLFTEVILPFHIKLECLPLLVTSTLVQNFQARLGFT